MEPDEPGGAAQQRPPLGDDSLTERLRRRLQRRSWRGSDGAELENWLDATAVGVTQRKSVAALCVLIITYGMEIDMSSVINSETPVAWGLRVGRQQPACARACTKAAAGGWWWVVLPECRSPWRALHSLSALLSPDVFAARRDWQDDPETLWIRPYCGLVAGALVAALMGDRFGRRSMLYAHGIVYTAATLVAAAASTRAFFLAARFAMALSLGVALPSAASLAAEIMPRPQR